MKKYLSVVFLFVLLVGNSALLKAEDLTPSDSYYKNNIAVNEVSAESPSARVGDDGFPDPGNPGGQEGGGGQVNAPIGDALLPILVVALLYASFTMYKSRKRKSTN